MAYKRQAKIELPEHVIHHNKFEREALRLLNSACRGMQKKYECSKEDAEQKLLDAIKLIEQRFNTPVEGKQ